MREHIDVIAPVTVRDKAGFTSTSDRIVATVRAYRVSGDPRVSNGLCMRI